MGKQWKNWDDGEFDDEDDTEELRSLSEQFFSMADKVARPSDTSLLQIAERITLEAWRLRIRKKASEAVESAMGPKHTQVFITATYLNLMGRLPAAGEMISIPRRISNPEQRAVRLYRFDGDNWRPITAPDKKKDEKANEQKEGRKGQ